MQSSSNTLKIKKVSRVERTQSFICEIPLATTLVIEKSIEAAFEASRQLYNACLGEGKRRLNLLRDSKEYQKARTLKKDDPSRKKLFKEAKDKYQFSEYSLHSYAGKVKNSWIGEHILTDCAVGGRA